MIILLAPEKLITSTTKSDWEGLKDLILFTSNSEQYREFLNGWPTDIFTSIEMFDSYATNDTVEVKLLEYSRKYNISNIIPMTEADILRTALLKKKIGIEGLNYSDAIKFRDKIIMKEVAKIYEINVPRFRRITNSIDLLDFVDEVGYPFIIKPILGRGSLNTICISDSEHMLRLLNEGLISDTSRYSDLLAEEFLDAAIYHIDGLQLNNKISTISVSKYVNNCLSFVGGSYLGSYTLDCSNPLRTKLIDFSKKLFIAFPLYKNALFHIEVFVDNNDIISLCEIACRLGGNGINDEVRLQQGRDIKMDFIRAECGFDNTSPLTPELYPVAGRLLVPPRGGRLISVPNECKQDGVIRYQIRGKAGQSYKKMIMSNDEIANFLITADNEREINDKISNLAAWFDRNTVWG